MYPLCPWWPRTSVAIGNLREPRALGAAETSPFSSWGGEGHRRLAPHPRAGRGGADGGGGASAKAAAGFPHLLDTAGGCCGRNHVGAEVAVGLGSVRPAGAGHTVGNPAAPPGRFVPG